MRFFLIHCTHILITWLIYTMILPIILGLLYPRRKNVFHVLHKERRICTIPASSEAHECVSCWISTFSYTVSSLLIYRNLLWDFHWALNIAPNLLPLRFFLKSIRFISFSTTFIETAWTVWFTRNWKKSAANALKRACQYFNSVVAGCLIFFCLEITRDLWYHRFSDQY